MPKLHQISGATRATRPDIRRRQRPSSEALLLTLLTVTSVTIVPYAAHHADVVRALNLAWIEELFSVEPRDREELDRPGETILAPGGRIIMAEIDGVIVGTCALLRVDATTFDLAKMAVAVTARRQGVGLALILAAINQAREHGANRINLLTHPLLADAVRLYRSVGFRDVPVPPVNYSRVGLAMTLELTGTGIVR